MKVRIVSPIYYFSIENNETIGLDNFFITKDLDKVKEMKGSNNFASKVGEAYMNALSNNYYVYFEGEHTDISVIKHCTTVPEMAHIMCGYLYSLFFKLWYIKDNSAFVYDCWVENLSITGGEVYHNTRDVLTSNYKGEYLTTHWQISELDAYFKILQNPSNPHIGPTNLVPENPQLKVKINTAVPNVSNYSPYTGERLDRAIGFLQFARANSNLIVKITFFVAIYECIFTSDANNISFNVRTRGADYLGGDIIANTKLLKDAYDVRSKYIHGEMVPSDRMETVK